MQLILNRRVSTDANAVPDDVRLLKKALNRLGYYFPDPKRGITNIADADMIDALKKFQRAQGLMADGVVLPGDDTMQAINKNLAAQEGKVKLVWRCPKDQNSCAACIARDGTAVDDESENTPNCQGNCRCWVTNDGMQTPVIYDPPIDAVYPVEATLGLLFFHEACLLVRFYSNYNKFTARDKKIQSAVNTIEKYLGGKPDKIIKNVNKDIVLIKDNKKIRMDINNYRPHQEPHFHLEKLVKKESGYEWVDESSQHIYTFKKD